MSDSFSWRTSFGPPPDQKFQLFNMLFKHLLTEPWMMQYKDTIKMYVKTPFASPQSGALISLWNI